ncbi:MAG: divergent PAP2 family protein [Oscillospiraceae bacterium]|nr:divergent PAP2 family protein [Oscillospiraceae bacterium]
MREFFVELLNNHFIVVSALSWFLAQVIKTLLNLIMTRELVMERMVGAGGMPSAHSAFVVSLAVTAGRICGWNSFQFAICFALATIVMYDATGVRHAAGEHAKVLNLILNSMSDNIRTMYEVEKKKNFSFFRKLRAEDPDDAKALKAQQENQKLLKELLGHTLLEVAGGVVLGLAVALLYPLP